MAIVLTESDVRELLTMEALIGAMEEALAGFSRRQVQQPLRSVLKINEQPSFFGVMPAFVPSIPALGTKLVTLFPANTERGLPTHLATIALFDPETGALIAMLDGRYITEARTAAVSAVSVKHLARADAAVLAIVGSGVQARSHLEAIAAVRPLRDVRVWSRSQERREGFAREMQKHTAAAISATASARAAVADADIVVLVTASHQPVVRSEWIADGTHICAVGACRPDQREMENKLVARGRLFVDSREGALSEAGDVVLAIEDGVIDASHVAGELGAVVSKEITGRRDHREVTIFKSLGMAVEDVAAAHLAYTRAQRTGTAVALDL
jgi:ornithine cyclodeaminase